MKSLWLLAGANGAGKTTFYQCFLKDKGIPFVNADVIAREMFGEQAQARSYDAAKLAEKQRERLLKEGLSFCFETVFSHPSKIDFVAQALGHGYEINLVYIHVANTDINVLRVYQRVSEGGHSVPEEKIRSRINRTMSNVATARQLATNLVVLDNSSFDKPYQTVLKVKNHQLTYALNPLPAWAHIFL